MGKAAAALADQFLTPEKPTRKVAAAAGHIWTPDRPEQPSAAVRKAHGSSGGVAGVRRAALELRQWSERGAASLAPDEDELEAVERQLDVGPTSVRSPVKRKAKLPESYEMLCEFFNCFESSTQLLRMKGSKASFPNICATIQHLSERKPQSIDVALLWPGRFVLCDFPGWHECLEILEVHSREVSLASDASLEDVASLTERFTGADPSLASLVHMPFYLVGLQFISTHCETTSEEFEGQA
uniref:Uncharacterized protein n=1 Tax=Oryza glumipatula TaxID=40148 RepID=A0A0D9ZGQ9_9ORYZ